MEDNGQIKKVQISDVDNTDGNLSDAQLDTISGGGSYGPCPACGGSPCACNG